MITPEQYSYEVLHNLIDHLFYFTIGLATPMLIQALVRWRHR